jgi:hypothetical protein
MRNVILGTIAGLAVGTLGALAYSHFVSDGQLADLQSQLDSANADLANLKKDRQQLSKETSGETGQVDSLSSANADLRKQLDDLKNAPPALNPMTLASMVMGMFRGGGFQAQQRMFLLQTRLHLTPDQVAAVKAAMDADNKARRDIGRQIFQGGKVDPAAAASANTLDATLAKVLSPDQMATYQQVQTDEKASRADTMATTQVDQMTPLLQLSDSQKDQLSSALYQTQLTAPDPMSLMTNPNAATVVAAQAQATQAAMAKVLTPDQMALYQQAGQSFALGGYGGRFRGGGGGGGGNGNAAAAPPPPPAGQ